MAMAICCSIRWCCMHVKWGATGSDLVVIACFLALSHAFLPTSAQSCSTGDQERKRRARSSLYSLLFRPQRLRQNNNLFFFFVALSMGRLVTRLSRGWNQKKGRNQTERSKTKERKKKRNRSDLHWSSINAWRCCCHRWTNPCLKKNMMNTVLVFLSMTKGSFSWLSFSIFYK